MANASTEQIKLVEGVVAAILTERELVINRGYNDGVVAGMKFRVLSEQPFEVIDPQTQRSLGFIDREKVRVEASVVKERLSICRTYRRVGVKGNAVMSLVDLLGPYSEIPETLKTDQFLHLPSLSESESYVRIGDRVVQLLPNE